MADTLKYRNNGEFRFTVDDDLDLDKIFNCGQCFRWKLQADGSYIGAARGCAARVRYEGNCLTISDTSPDSEAMWRDYFDLDRSYFDIRERVSNCPYMQEASEFGKGIRLLNQDKWEALCSFIFSQCNNITRISGIIESFCRLFGEDIPFEDGIIHGFPKVERVAQLTEEDMAPVRSGYRAPYVILAAKEIAEGRLDLDKTSQLPTDEAIKVLRSLRGVGEKVANCVLLFGLGKKDAFPIDVWMRRALKENFPADFDPSTFGENAGVAQQYIFFYARTGGKSNG